MKHVLLHGFVPVIVMPTRITSRSATLIDHIYYYGGNNNNGCALEQVKEFRYLGSLITEDN